MQGLRLAILATQAMTATHRAEPSLSLDRAILRAGAGAEAILDKI
jgi:hypothetical protein